MVLRIAAKNKLNTNLPVLWLNHVAVGLEINQTRSSSPLSLSLLTACTHKLIELLGSSPVEADAKFEKGLTRRIGKIPYGTSRRNFDPIVSWEWPLWKVLQHYIECEVDVTTDSDDLLPIFWTRLYERDPLGHTGTPLREGYTEVKSRTHLTAPSSWPRLGSFGVSVETRSPEFAPTGAVLRI